MALIQSLNLPCKFIVHSGGHSAHAIVHIDAGTDQAEYRKRVEFLYKTCREHGLKADKTGNPSRLSRLPGVIRDGNPQYIIARDIGPDSWEEWVDFLEEQADDLPPFDNAAEQLLRVERGDLPLRPELIEGILRSGHKMRLTGPSKAGKSFALLELAVSLTEGVPSRPSRARELKPPPEEAGDFNLPSRPSRARELKLRPRAQLEAQARVAPLAGA